MKNISQIAMIARPCVSRWGGKKVDGEVTKKVNGDMKASEDAGKYTKILVTCNDLARINSIYRRAWSFHEKNTLPWNKNGEGILPTANYTAYKEGMDAIKADFDDAVTEFIAMLPAIEQDAKERLGSMYSPEDFPSASDLRKRFKLAINIYPIPDPNDFRLNIKAEEVERLREAYGANISATLEQSMQELWRRLYDQAKRMADTLSDPDKKFQKTMLENAREIVDLLPRLNLSGDVALEEMRSRMEKELLNYDTQDLRDDIIARRETANAATDLVATMEKYQPQLRSIEF